MRTILGAYLRIHPKLLVFETGPEGKPEIAAASSRRLSSLLKFNVSHTEGAMLLAVAWDTEVGVDIERVRPVPEARSIAQKFLSEKEKRALRTRSPHDISRDFLACWVRKESCVKALRRGLLIPLHEFDVPIGSRLGAQWVVIKSRVDADTCLLTSLDLGSQFVGAIAVQGYPLPSPKLMHWTWPADWQ